MGKRDEILAIAASYEGTPYGLPPGPGQVDCSSYVLKVFLDARIPFTAGVRTAEQERQACEEVDWGSVQPGDLLFFEHTYEPSEPPGPDGHVASHVGISLGVGTQRMWDAHESAARDGVGLTNIGTDYWQDKLFWAGRPRQLEDDNPGGGGVTVDQARRLADHLDAMAAILRE